MGKIESFKDLIVYQKAYKLAMEIFEISKTFPREENETEAWLDYSLDCSFTSIEIHETIIKGYDEVRKMLISMINNPQKWRV